MPRLFIRVLSEANVLPDGEGYELGVEWLIKEADGSVRGGGVTDYRGLADIADPNVDWLTDPDNTVVFLPSQFVLVVNCEVPGRSTAQIRRALPFAAEEFVATDIEQMHIAHGAIKAGTPVLCNIVAHEVMQGWLECFKSIGVNPGAFILDAAVLPSDENTASVLFDGNTALVASLAEAATIDRGNLVFALNTLDVDHIVTINGELSDIERGQLENNPEVEFAPVSENGVLDYLADRVPQANYINLLQERYKAIRPKSANAGRWRAVGALAAIWVVVAFLGMVVQGWWASSEAERLEAESYALYKQAFPRESQPRSLDQLQRRMRAKLGQSGANGESSAFVGLTAQFANVIDDAGIVDSLSYSEQRQELTVELMLKSYADLDVIKDKLAGTGVEVEVVSAEQEESGARSRLRVRYAS